MTGFADIVRSAVTPARMRAAAQAAVRLARPAFVPDGRNLVYILSQSARFGHFGMETQILRTLYEGEYDRIVVVTGRLDEPGTNPWIPACAGPRIRFVHTGDVDVLLLGQLDLGLQRHHGFDLLLSGPRETITSFYRHILAGGAVRSLELPPEAEARARSCLMRHGVDPDRPFVFFHNRTLSYLPEMAYHRHRTAEVASYRESIARLIEAGYGIIRIGEPGLERLGFAPRDYADTPDWPDRDPALDLFVCARCAFGLAQNSGPIWVAAAFGRQVLRTNMPFEHLSMPYNGDISLFKRYRRAGDGEFLSYRGILAAGLPAMNRAEEIADSGHEIVPNTPDELLAATEEMLARIAGAWRPDAARQARFRRLGQAYERLLRARPARARQAGGFYGYAHPGGVIAQSFLLAHPDFLA